MTPRPIGYYVHHQGAGHLGRARAIAAASSLPVTLLGTGIGAHGIDLADDRPITGRFDGADDAGHRPDALHYAPLDHDGIRSRVARIADWIATEKPQLIVVDVSVEVAMLARLASVPTLYVRLNGHRKDAAHLDAFRGARALLAPFHPNLEAASTPAWVQEKTRYLPGIVARPHYPRGEQRVVVVVQGRGGPPADGETMAAAADASPGWRWQVIGPCTLPRRAPANLEVAGWVADPERRIAAASVVVGAAGDGLLGSVLAADRPFICIPEARAYGEQHATARRLGELGAAVVLDGWPPPSSWPGLIAAAINLAPEPRRRLHDPQGAQKAADWIDAVAASTRRAPKPVA